MIDILDGITLEDAAMLTIEAIIVSPSIDTAEFDPRTGEMTIHFAHFLQRNMRRLPAFVHVSKKFTHGVFFLLTLIPHGGIMFLWKPKTTNKN